MAVFERTNLAVGGFFNRRFPANGGLGGFVGVHEIMFAAILVLFVVWLVLNGKLQPFLTLAMSAQ